MPTEIRKPVRVTDPKAIARTLLMMNFFHVKPIQSTSIIALKDRSLSGARMQANAPSVRDVTPPAETPTVSEPEPQTIPSDAPAGYEETIAPGGGPSGPGSQT